MLQLYAVQFATWLNITFPSARMTNIAILCSCFASIPIRILYSTLFARWRKGNKSTEGTSSPALEMTSCEMS